MSWLLALLVLALVAFFVVKFMKSSTLKQQQEHQHLQKARLDATTDAHAHQSSEPETSSSSTSTAQNAGAAAAAAVAGVGAVAVAQSTSSAPASSSEPASLQTGNSMSDVREMIKILNLDGADSRRLDISSEELTALRKGDAAGIPDNAKLEDVAMRLRKMLA